MRLLIAQPVRSIQLLHAIEGVKLDENNHAIIAENVYKHFGEVKALDGVSIAAETGKVLGLLGPNGAGKTTLVRILATLLKPDSGVVSVGGIDVLRHKQQVREIIGLAGQYAAVDEILTGRENLIMVGRLYHMSHQRAKERAAELLAQFALTDAADRSVKTYSGGMRRRLDLAASMVARPNILSSMSRPPAWMRAPASPCGKRFANLCLTALRCY